MQDSLPAGGLRLYREGVEPSGSLRKVSGYISLLLSRTSPVARVVYAKRPFGGPQQVLDYLGRYTHRVAIANRSASGSRSASAPSARALAKSSSIPSAAVKIAIFVTGSATSKTSGNPCANDH